MMKNIILALLLAASFSFAAPLADYNSLLGKTYSSTCCQAYMASTLLADALDYRVFAVGCIQPTGVSEESKHISNLMWARGGVLDLFGSASYACSMGPGSAECLSATSAFNSAAANTRREAGTGKSMYYDVARRALLAHRTNACSTTPSEVSGDISRRTSSYRECIQNPARYCEPE